jgi:nucleoside-diphosphate-sugar epimerase
MATVFVTGGSGFVGSRLITRLIKHGHAVRALARSDTATGKVKDLGAVPVRGDLTDVAGLRAAAAGSELAFHAAAPASSSGPTTSTAPPTSCAPCAKPGCNDWSTWAPRQPS